MNISANLERAHILGVCASLAAPTTPLEDQPDRTADGVTVFTLAYPTRRRRDRVERALANCGYATEKHPARGPHPYAVRVTGWSTDRLEHRAGRLRRAAAQLNTDSRLQNTIARAIDAAAGQPADTDPRAVAYDLAAEATGPVISSAIHKAGPLIPLTRIPADPYLAVLLLTDQRLTDQLNSVIGDHFNAACIAAGTYIHTRHEHTRGQTNHLAEETTADQAAHQPTDHADRAAREEAWAEARAFAADPVDFGAFVHAIEWARDVHPGNAADAAAFALDYACDCHGADRDQWPPLPDAYRTWSAQPRPATGSAPQIAAADFPNRPGAVAADQPEQVQNATGPSRTRAPRRPQ